jgi:predicted NAD-dependent protein-ADP-ribosyltransferase YbiA (DUF1768 family)
LITKFKQHAELREKLVATGEALLVERSPSDSFWGCGSDGKGLNLLGQMVWIFFFFFFFFVCLDSDYWC